MSVSRNTEIEWSSVGRRVREIRGFDDNQKVFARVLGVSQDQLSRYERGESEIGAAVLLRLARKSGKTIEWLLTGTNRLKNVTAGGDFKVSGGTRWAQTLDCREMLNLYETKPRVLWHQSVSNLVQPSFTKSPLLLSSQPRDRWRCEIPARQRAIGAITRGTI
jgi:transcriptional regulator with XRE-family HTH domain